MARTATDESTTRTDRAAGRPDHARRRARCARDGAARDDADDGADRPLERAHRLARLLERDLQLDARDDRAGPGPADPPRLADPRDEGGRRVLRGRRATRRRHVPQRPGVRRQPHRGLVHVQARLRRRRARLLGWSARGTWPTRAGRCPGATTPRRARSSPRGSAIPPIKIHDEGRERSATSSTCSLTNTRTRRNQAGDLRAQLGAVNVGEAHLLALVREVRAGRGEGLRRGAALDLAERADAAADRGRFPTARSRGTQARRGHRARPRRPGDRGRGRGRGRRDARSRSRRRRRSRSTPTRTGRTRRAPSTSG